MSWLPALTLLQTNNNKALWSFVLEMMHAQFYFTRILPSLECVSVNCGSPRRRDSICRFPNGVPGGTQSLSKNLVGLVDQATSFWRCWPLNASSLSTSIPLL